VYKTRPDTHVSLAKEHPMTKPTTSDPANDQPPAYVLHKEHAVVHTASIDVKIMRLNKRQVTMSVFRQLDHQPIFLSDGSLCGTPWGRVNYTWNGNPDGTAFHVVWQEGDRLKRSPVPRRECLEWQKPLSDWLADWENAGVAQVFEGGPREYRWNHYEKWARAIADSLATKGEDGLYNTPYDWFRPYEDEKWKIKVLTQANVFKPLNSSYSSSGHISFHVDQTATLDATWLANHFREAADTAKRQHQTWQEAMAEWQDRRRQALDRIARRVDEMAQLDQLFIAV
jgi:hypothetical protein